MKSIKELFENFLPETTPSLMKTFGYTPRYDRESLVEMEALINGFYPLGHEPLSTTLIPFGYIYGETIIRSVARSKWNLDEVQHLNDLYIRVPHGTDSNGEEIYAHIFPFRRIERFWFDRSDGLVVMFDTINLMSLQFIDPTKMKPEEWVNMPFGRIRTREVKEQ